MAKPETRALKDKCTLIASVDGGKLRILGVSDEPLVILKGQECALRELNGQVQVVQRDRVSDAPSAPDPHEDAETDFEDDLP